MSGPHFVNAQRQKRFGEQEGGKRNGERLVDVLDVSGAVIHIYPITLGQSDEANDAAYEAKALEAAAHGRLGFRRRTREPVCQNTHQSRGQMVPYGDGVVSGSETKAALGQTVRERAYFLWGRRGAPKGMQPCPARAGQRPAPAGSLDTPAQQNTEAGARPVRDFKRLHGPVTGLCKRGSAAQATASTWAWGTRERRPLPNRHRVRDGGPASLARPRGIATVFIKWCLRAWDGALTEYGRPIGG
jgi:hypothetical protein